MTEEVLKQLNILYVRKEIKKGDDGSHACHGGMPGCKGTCPAAAWGCKSCWYKLPVHLRGKIWDYYRAGQEKDKRPSREYLVVAREVQEWIDRNYPGRSKHG